MRHWLLDQGPQTNRQQESHHNKCERIPTAHEITSRSDVNAVEPLQFEDPISPLAIFCAGTITASRNRRMANE
jgi:hypothetical protein